MYDDVCKKFLSKNLCVHVVRVIVAIVKFDGENDLRFEMLHRRSWEGVNVIS